MSFAPVNFESVYLAPHLDDAVLSCGGRIHQQVRAGRRVAVLTVFAGDLQDDSTNRVLAEVYERMRLRPSRAMAARRREDVEACRRLGVEPVQWPLPEALGRHRALRSVDALFEEPPAADGALVTDLAQRLARLGKPAEIVAPLGLGGHLDHRVVRRAAEAAFGSDLVFYEDYPYVEQVGGATGQPQTAGLASEITPLGDVDLTARIEAIECYTSQIAALFGSRLQRLLPGRSVGAAIRRQVRRLGGERYWSLD